MARAREWEKASVRSVTTDPRLFERSLEVLVLAAFVVLFYVVPEGATPWVMVANLVTFYALFLRAIAVPDRILPWLPSYLSIEVLFFVFSYLIFYYEYQLWLLGDADPSVSVYVSNSFVAGSNKAITLATIGMLAFTLGYRSLGPATRDVGAEGDPYENRRDGQKDTSPQYFRAVATASSALLLALVALYLLAGWRSADEGRYTETTTQGPVVEGTFTLILMCCMIVAALWTYAAAAELRRPPMLAVGLVAAIAWSVRLLVFGDRSSFLLVALVLVAGYLTFVRRASLIAVAVAFGVWMFVYRIIEMVRSIPNWYDSGNIWELMRSSPDYQASSSESSFNITTITLRATVETVPDIHHYTYGVLKLLQFSSAIPFSAKLYLPYLDLDYTHSSGLVGDAILGPNRGAMAVGTNVISDSYIDFGVAGVIAGLFAIGLFAKAIRNYAARDPYDPRRVIIYLLTLASLAELPRYAIDLPIRILVWAVVFCALVGTVTERSRWQASARPGRTTGPRATSAALGHKPGNVARRVGFAIQSEFPQIESGEKS